MDMYGISIYATLFIYLNKLCMVNCSMLPLSLQDQPHCETHINSSLCLYLIALDGGLVGWMPLEYQRLALDALHAQLENKWLRTQHGGRQHQEGAPGECLRWTRR